MNYAKRILSIFLILCVLASLSTAVFAGESDEMPPVDAVAEEPAPEEPAPADEGAPSTEALPDEGAEPEESTLPEETGGEEPTDAEETPPASEIAAEESASDAPIEAETPESTTGTEESTAPAVSSEPVAEDEEAPAEEPVDEESEEKVEDATAVDSRAETKASGVAIVHSGNAINTNGTLTISYYNYLVGGNRTAYIQAIDLKTINGAVVYCLAPEMGSEGKNYTQDEQNFAWKTKIPWDMRYAIGVAMGYGYPNQNYSASANDIYWYGKQAVLNTENYIATQLIIWEILAGVRSSQAPYALKGSTSYRNAFDSGWNTIRTTYDAIVAKMANHNSIPAYASRSQGAYVYELKYNSSTGTYRYMLPTERQSDWRNCLMKLPDGITYLKKSDNMTVIGFEATVAAAKALPKDGYTVTGESPFLSVDPDTAGTSWMCSDSQPVIMPAKADPAKAYFTLKAASADLEIVKTSPNGNIANIEFYIKDSSGKEVGRDKTDSGGKLKFENLVIGQTYTVTEVVKDGWICENNNQKITIQAGTNTLKFVNKRLDLKLIKKSPDGNTKNITFNVYQGDTNYKNGTVWKTVSTGIDGSFTIQGIPAGDYWFREVPMDGYEKQPDQKVTVTTKNTYDNPAIVTFVNVPLSSLKIVKQSPDGKVKDITFNVYQGDANYQNKKIMQTVVSGADGTIQIDKLTAGVYWIEEIVSDDYEEQEPQRVEVTTANTKDKPAIVTFVNVPLSSLKIVKQSPDGKVKDITFNVYQGDANYQNKKIMQTVVSGADGTIQIDKLTAGVYWVREIVPEGYVAPPDQRVVVTEENTKENPAIVTFVNTLLRGSVSVNKVSTSGVALKGATFLLEYSTDNGATWTAVKPATEDENGIGTCSTVGEDGTLTTGEDGQAVFDGLIVYGVSYRLTETVAPPGYQLLADPVFNGGIVADDDGNYKIYCNVVNTPKLQMPPTGADGSVRLICAIATVVASASLLGLGLVCKRRKSPESNG